MQDGSMDKTCNPGKNTIFKKEIVIMLCFAVLVFLINIRYLGSLGIFTVLDDEFGYWGNAAYLAGLDWSDAVSKIPYYSYGYSLLLVPLFWIFDNPVHMYKAAIILNGIMLSLSFLLCYDIAKKLANTVNHYILIALSLLVSMFPAYITYSSIAWCECLLILTFWILTWCFTNLNDKSSKHKFILIGILSVYVYIVHQRALGILIASITVILLMRLCNKINWKQFICVVLPVIVLAITHFYLKDFIQSHIWLNSSNNLANDYTAQMGKINQLFTIEGLIQAFKILLGQFFYLGAASYLLCYFGLSELIKQIKLAISGFMVNNDTDLDNKFFLYVFLLIALLLSLAISVIFMINPTRIDQVVYGRYILMAIGPVILIGLIKLTDKESIPTRDMILTFISFGCLTVFVNFILKEFSLMNHNAIHDIGLLFMTTSFNVYPSALIAILMCRLIILSKNSKLIIATMLITAVLFFYSGDIVTRSIITLNQERMELIKMVDLITTAKHKLPIYFLWDDQNSPVYDKWDNRKVCDRLIADCYQFLFKEKKIKMVNSKELSAVQEDKLVLSGEIYNLFDLMEDYTFCTSAGDSYLLASKSSGFAHYFNNSARINISLDQFDVTNAICNQNYIKNDENAGLFMEGPFKKINKGKYSFMLDTELISYRDDDLGYAEVYSLTDKKILNYTRVNLKQIENNVLFWEVPFELKIDSDYIGIRVYANEGTQLKINNVYIQREQQ